MTPTAPVATGPAVLRAPYSKALPGDNKNELLEGNTVSTNFSPANSYILSSMVL